MTKSPPRQKDLQMPTDPKSPFFGPIIDPHDDR